MGTTLRAWVRGTIVVLALYLLWLPGAAAARPQTVRAAAPPQLMFGIGSEADGARTSPLAVQAPVKMLTSWYNGPGDLAWMQHWQTTEVPADYAAGYAMHLVVWTSGSGTNIATPYGPACGQPYALSAGFLNDMTRLATIFKGSGPLYVSMFAEFQTYTCVNNQWSGNENYWRALKDQYTKARDIFHQIAPNAKVALCWGGWQMRWDDPAKGAGRSLFPYFADVLATSDFQSFQAMASDSNVADVQAMTARLHQWGPVMLAYYQPGNGSQALFDADTQAMLTDGFLQQAIGNGLFAFNLLDSARLDPSPASFSFVKAAVARYGIPRATPPPPPSGTLFATGFEDGEIQTTWNDTVDFSRNAGGFCCGLQTMESSRRKEVAHAGSGALMYSGSDNDTGQSFSYNRIFDLRGRTVTIGATSTLSYWIYPQDAYLGAGGRNSVHVAIDIIFSDGSSLRDSGVVDQFGVRLHPQYQGDGGHLIANQWNLVTAALGARLAGRTIDHLLVGYDQPGATGQYRGYIDDLVIQ